MKKIYLYLCSIFLAILMMCSSAPLAQGATHVSVTWSPAYHPPTYLPGYNQQWFDNYEKPAQSSITNYITNTAPQAGSNWVSKNNLGSNTNAQYVYQNSQAIQSTSSYDFLATFHVGDFYPKPITNGYYVEVGEYWNEAYEMWFPLYEWVTGTTTHYAYYGSNGASNGIVDRDLYQYTGAKHKFTFIWTCVNGGLNIKPGGGYGYEDTTHWTGIVGMPYAWTRKSNMSTNGYSSPDNSGVAYIGFENTSKYLTDNSDFITYNYGDFGKEFYYNLLVKHYTVKESLNAAAAKVMGGSQYNFSHTTLNTGYLDPSGTGNTCRMRVIGDGNMVLPY